MDVRERRGSGTRERRDTSALAEHYKVDRRPQSQVSRGDDPAAIASTAEEVLEQRFLARSVVIVRELLREHREALMRRAPPPRDSRHVAHREDLDAASHVDELTRARARQLIQRATQRRGGSR